ncbi:hypothetical protein HRI_003956500 [Hibiscus trionum]|uniref:Uncharacterized protein n=1 Tax=Hibiscus trionum TaxID=183268 RepID=A0A9W7MG33_HIBTR|nr:hypothetical protein HRI_003956500 [Hibiscus trionum]
MDPSLNGDGRVFENHNVLHKTARECNKEAWVQWMMPFGARTSPSRTTKLIGSKHYRLLLMTSIQSRK